MASILVKGAMATVELTSDDGDGGVIATCIEHDICDGRLTPPGNCGWTTTYDDMNDATEYSQGHADNGDQ